MARDSSDFGRIKTEHDGDLIFCSVGLYKAFLARGAEGMDAYLLYSHLIFTARLQNTETVLAKDVYLKNGLGMGRRRLMAAKHLLHDMKLIEYVQRRDEKGRVQEAYIEVHFRSSAPVVPETVAPEAKEPPKSPVVPPTAPTADRTTRPGPQMLKETTKMLEEERETKDTAATASVEVVTLTVVPDTKRLEDDLYQAFLNHPRNGGRFVNYAAERKGCKRLVTEAMARAPDDPRGWLSRAVKTFMQIKRESHSEFWHGMGILPSKLASKAVLEAILERFAQEADGRQTREEMAEVCRQIPF